MPKTDRLAGALSKQQEHATPAKIDAAKPPPATLAVPPAESPATRGIARAKLWGLDKKYHCLIIGTCLSTSELAKLARRFNFNSRPNDDYGKHVEAVGWCGSRNAVSATLQKSLDQRYAAALKDFAADRDAGAVLERWNKCLARGDVAGPLWAAVTHKHAGQEVRQAAYAAVHMLSHRVGAGLAADVRRLAFLEHDNTRLQHELSAERAALAQRAELNADAHRALGRELAMLRDENHVLRRDRERLNAIENGVTMTEMGRRLLALKNENRALQLAAARSAVLTERHERLESELAAAHAEKTRLRAERDTLERLLDEPGTGVDQPAHAGLPAVSGGAAACASTDDCLRCAEQNGLSRARCILCVGGRTSLLSHYRALADRLGLKLIHHDGGQQEALSRLPEMIASADAVLCPTDCVGHAAYYSLKQQCRKSGKPCLLFKGAGVTSFAFALSRLSAGEATLNNTPPDVADLQKNPGNAT